MQRLPLLKSGEEEKTFVNKERNGSMIRELQLTPEELFYLGKIYEGEYLNYSYLQAMKDIGNSKRSFKSGCKTTLLEKGAIEENLLGDISFNEEIKELLTPIYFGKFAAVIEVYEAGETQTRKVINLHFHNGNYVMVYQKERVFQVHSVTEAELQQFVFVLMPENYNDSKPPTELKILNETLKRVLVIKNTHIGEDSVIKFFYDYDSYLCEKQTDGTIYVLSPKEFFDKAYACLKGGE